MSLVFDADLSPTEKLVLLALADFANDDGRSIYPSIGKLCRKTSLTTRSVQNQLKKLRAFKVLGYEHIGKNRPSTYFINIEELTRMGVQHVHPTPHDVHPHPALRAPDTSLTINESSVEEHLEELAKKHTGFDIMEYNRIWREKYGGDLPFTRCGRGLKLLEAEFGARMALEAFRKYVADTDHRFASVMAFLGKPRAFMGIGISTPDMPKYATREEMAL
jgi:hypothetical protein